LVLVTFPAWWRGLCRVPSKDACFDSYTPYMAEQAYRYDVALSFAGEDRPYVNQVAASLKDNGVKVFYDDYEKVALWGRDLYAHLDWVYRTASRYCVIFISKSYAAKVWTNHERASAQARALTEHKEYVLPARFDDTEIPGLLPTIGYMSLRDVSPADLAVLLLEKLGPRKLEPGFPTNVGRLIEELNYKGSVAAKKRKNEEASDIAYSFYEALGRMTIDERRAVAGVFAFGCPGELRKGVHISLNLLSRMTKMPEAQLLDSLGAVRSLNIKSKLRDPPHAVEPDDLVADDKDILVSFWSSDVPHSDDATKVAFQAVNCAAQHFCSEHGLEVVTHLDFHRLSSNANLSEPVTFSDEEHSAPSS
jgi:hypothetical protein